MRRLPAVFIAAIAVAGGAHAAQELGAARAPKGDAIDPLVSQPAEEALSAVAGRGLTVLEWSTVGGTLDTAAGRVAAGCAPSSASGDAAVAFARMHALQNLAKSLETSFVSGREGSTRTGPVHFDAVSSVGALVGPTRIIYAASVNRIGASHTCVLLFMEADRSRE